MSDDSSAGDADFFDQQSTRRSASKTAAAKRSPSHSSDASSRHHSSRRSGSSDESDSDDSSEETGETSDENEPRGRRKNSSSVKDSVVIPLPPDDDHGDGEQSDDSKSADGGSTEHTEPVQEQPPCRRNRNKKSAGERKTVTADQENRNHGKLESSRGSVPPAHKSRYSSDDQKRHLETACSGRPISSRSGSQQHGTYRISRAISAPARRPPQSRPMSGGFCNGSRMDVKTLLESLLQAENSRPRRKSVADPVEFRRKRNYTFSDKRLDTIERENKRLLDKIVKIHYTEPSYGGAGQRRPTPVKPMTAFPNVARIKQLERVEKDNLVWYMNVFSLNV